MFVRIVYTSCERILFIGGLHLTHTHTYRCTEGELIAGQIRLEKKKFIHKVLRIKQKTHLLVIN